MKKTLLFLNLALLFFLNIVNLEAQCPPSKDPSIHVVKKGETYYSIARMYNISLNNLYAWNNLTEKDVLPVCKELKVMEARPAVVTEQPAPSTPTPSTEKPAPVDQQKYGIHVVQYGENLRSIANSYGYTESFFRKFNQLKENQDVQVGTILKSTHCTCPEDIAKYPKPDIPEVAAEAGTIKKSHNLMPAIPKDQPLNKEEKQPEKSPEVPLADSRELVPEVASAYMRPLEIQMLEEINLLRSNPPGYIPFIEAYLKEILELGAWGNEIEAGHELIEELRGTPPMAILQPTECIYAAGKNHAMDQQRRGFTDHIGSDGSWPWDRIMKACNSMRDGNENLVGGISDVRKATIALLVDDGIPNRGHRKTLLRPDWKYGSCYFVGQVKDIEFNWIQLFGK